MTKERRHGWTAEQDAELRRLVADGLSGVQIAKTATIAALRPGLTRNAVIARIHRLGIAWRTAPGKKAMVRAPETRAPEPRVTMSAKPNGKRAEPPGLPKVRSSTPLDVRIDAFDQQPATQLPLMQRKPSQCAWPVGEPERPADQLCCGAAVASLEAGAPPYCGWHMTLRRGAPVRRIKLGSAP